MLWHCGLCLESQYQGGRGRWIPGAYWPAHLGYSPNSRLVRDPAYGREVEPEKTQSCLLTSTHTCAHIQILARMNTHTHNVVCVCEFITGLECAGEPVQLPPKPSSYSSSCSGSFGLTASHSFLISAHSSCTPSPYPSVCTSKKFSLWHLSWTSMSFQRVWSGRYHPWFLLIKSIHIAHNI